MPKPAPTSTPAPVPVSAPVPLPIPSPTPISDTDRERTFGLLLFEAEETLARGHPDKAVVMASRAVRDRPDSLTARSLLERARRELLRGRKKGRLEERLVEARQRLEAGDILGAQKIVGAALKLVPDNAVALELFGLLKERRLQGTSVEAEAERELDRLNRERARMMVATARRSFAAGANLRALLGVRRGLRLMPDDPDLLSLLAEIQQTLLETEAPRAPRRALLSQVRLAQDLLRDGNPEESLKILRAVLHEDVHFGPAQAAIQEVRRTHLARTGVPLPVAPIPAAPAEPSHSQAAPEFVRASQRPPLRPASDHPVPRTLPSRPPASADRTPHGVPPRGAAAIPPEIALRRSRRTPWGIILAGGTALVLVALFVLRRDPAAPAGRGTPPATSAPAPLAAGASSTGGQDDTGPLATVEPELRQGIKDALTAYGRALERMDAQLLAQARPDLTAAQRAQVLAPFQGALNVATDLRVLDVVRRGDVVVVPVLRTDVIIGGRGSSGPPVEEELRFQRGADGWTLSTRK